MLQQECPAVPLEIVVRGIAAYAVRYVSSGWVFDEQFTDQLSLLRSDEVKELSRLIEANRVTVPVYEALSEIDVPAAGELRDSLRAVYLKIKEHGRYRDTLLRRLVDVLDGGGVDYVVFKTFNRLGSVGVDIDILINSSSFDLCVGALLADGFFAVDDLAKRYATGFMIRGNPIIVDLHTELAVLGVRYMSPDLMLRNRQRVLFQPSDGSTSFSLIVLENTMDTLVRMAHSVLKEGQVTINDVAETLHGFSGNLNLMMKYTNEENLQFAASIFSSAAQHMLNEERFKRLMMFDETHTQSIVRRILNDSLMGSLPPFKLPIAVCLLAFFDHLRRNGEICKYLPILIYSFKFRRNAAHLGRKMLERLT